jgi:CheY-like chemotaxis protein
MLKDEAPISPEARSGRVLVADDDPTVREFICKVFSDTDLELCTVSTGTEALALMASEQFAVLLLDLVMPGMGGMNVLAAMNKSSINVPVVVLTGFHKLYDRKKFAEFGVRKVLSKPCGIEEIRSAVFNIVGQS